MSRRLSQSQIDEVLKRLLAADVEQVSRSRAGEGFGSRGGSLYRLSVEENDREETAVTEAQLRAYLADLDLDNYIERYAIWALAQLGVAIDGPKLP